MNITEESSGQPDVNIMAPRDARDCCDGDKIFLRKSGFTLYFVCHCKVSPPARAAMEAAAGARAAALGVGADAWHSAPNLEARGGETKKPFFGLKFQTGLRRRGGIGARPRRGARGLSQPLAPKSKKISSSAPGGGENGGFRIKNKKSCNHIEGKKTPNRCKLGFFPNIKSSLPPPRIAAARERGSVINVDFH